MSTQSAGQYAADLYISQLDARYPRVLASSAAATSGGAGVNTTPVAGGSVKPMLSVNIPAGSLSAPGSVLEVDYAWSMTSSANPKSLSLFLGGRQVGPTDSQTIAASSTGRIRIRNGGTPSMLIVDALPFDGSSTVPFASLTLDTTIDQQLSFRGSCANSADSMHLTSYEVALRRPATPAAAPALVAGQKTFYGVNSHCGYYPAVSPTDMITIMKSLGTTTLRLDYYGSGQNEALQNYAQAFTLDGSGLQVYAVLGASMESSPGVAYATEAAAYAANFALGQSAALALAPYGVTLYGCGNELDSKSAGGVYLRTPNNSVQGTKAADFNTAIWPLLRGAVNGCMDGVRSVQPPAMCACNAFTNASIFLSDCLWNGTNLDGTPGFQPCRWDITDWHLYTEGDATRVDYSGSTGTVQFDLLAYLSQAYGRPILISEFNPAIGGVTDCAATATAIDSWLTTWYENQDKYNIAGVMFYDLFDSPYQIINHDAAPYTLNAAGVAYQNFIATHPAQR